MTTKVLIVDPDIAFTVPVKRALEQSGDYEVNVFANGLAACELLRREAHDVAIVDFDVDDLDMPALIRSLRDVQPGLFILASPRTPEQIAQLARLDVQGSITKPYLARQLAPVIREAVAAKLRLAKKEQERRVYSALARGTTSSESESSTPSQPSARPSVQPPVHPHIDEPATQPDDTFRRMANANDAVSVSRVSSMNSAANTAGTAGVQEPPIPEGATLRELVSGTQTMPPASLPELPSADLTETQPDQAMSSLAVEVPHVAELAALALDAVADDTISIEQVSVQAIVERADLALGPAAVVLPAWVQQTPDDADLPTLVGPVVNMADLAGSNRPTSTPNVGRPELPPLVKPPLARPPVVLPPAPPPTIGDTQPGGGLVQKRLESDREHVPGPAVEQHDLDDKEPSFVASIPDEPEPTAFAPGPQADLTEPEPESLPPQSLAATSEISEPELAALAETPAVPAPESTAATVAVQLTQLTVDSAAQSTVLTRNGELLAVAGPMPQRVLPGVVQSINQTWQGANEDGNALIRFINVATVGDYLLYSTRTVESMTLSMLFPAETPLRIIRQQAKQLLKALESVPEPADYTNVSASGDVEAARTLPSRPTDLRAPGGLRDAINSAIGEADASATDSDAKQVSAGAAAVPVPAPRAEGPYAAYAFVWLPRTDMIGVETTRMLVEWLNAIAAAHAWELQGVEIQPSYVTVQISIPANETPTTTVETLMRETAERANDPYFWLDAYYIVASGRAITQQEITSFMEYHRDAQDAA